MPRHLPYQAITATGRRLEVRFPLHPETRSAVRVAQLIDTVLAALDREVSLDAATGNGDVLQAVAMALAIRSAIIDVPKAVTDRMTVNLVDSALAAVDDAVWSEPVVGHA